MTIELLFSSFVVSAAVTLPHPTEIGRRDESTSSQTSWLLQLLVNVALLYFSFSFSQEIATLRSTVRMSSTQWPAAKVRSTFVKFFEEHYNHKFVKSSPCIPTRDPTLLFTNAGMNQFKDLFLGTADPHTEFGQLKRVANSQLCIRAGGKHNDLEDVGRDTYHHTFFEMLGTWSFGDYFKREAITWAWELLTKEYGLPADRLYVTYFEGSPANNLTADEEARQIWLDVGVPSDRIIKGNMKDNFWEMGDVGPCGPCTEIHFDRIGGRNAAHLVNKDDPMVLEIWNLVFMQFNRGTDGKLQKLPCGHVDTGMGLERLVSVLQNVPSNYDTDLWTPVFARIQEVTKFPTSYQELVKNETAANRDAIVAFRVVADHIRCLTVALADGAMPDNVGRGFVLRRIIRRAVRFGVQFLGAEFGFFSELVPAVVDLLGDFFPHLREERTQRRVKAILKDEEMGFAKTWKVGLKHFETAKSAAVDKMISGKDAFILHDRYGFPVDLTCLLAEKEGMTVDIKEFNREMKASQTSGGRMQAMRTFFDTYQIDELSSKKTPTTDDSAKHIWEPFKSQILAIFDKTSGKFVAEVSTGGDDDSIGIVVKATSFYAEAGGQVYDTGAIVAAEGTFHVEKVYSYGGYVVHIGRVAEGVVKVADEVELSVNYERRLPIAANHTCTHQLNHSLRQILQFENADALVEVNQRGSLVNEDYLRFDFSWPSKLSADQLARVEAHLNSVIESKPQVFSKSVPYTEALKINSLRCMFDEKYPEIVTVVSVGRQIEDMLKNPTSEDWKNYSIELCGGTHLTNLFDAQQAVIIGEDALMKGVRRILVYTRAAAREARLEGDAFKVEFDRLKATTDMDLDDKLKAYSVLAKKVNDSTIPLLTKCFLRDAVDAEIKATNAAKKNEGARLKATADEAGAKVANGVPPSEKWFVFHATEFGAEREALQSFADGFAKVRPSTALFVVGGDVKKDKALAIVTVPEKHAVGADAVKWAQAACFGKGGGKPCSAQSGLPVDKILEVLHAAKDFAAKHK